VIARISWPFVLVLVIALTGAGVVQHYVEERRIESKLIWTDPEDKEALEIGFMALGGFRGLLADLLWFKAQTQQDSAHYYNLKLLCDLIQKLQPTFSQVNSFQADAMAYNIANHADSCEDKWYWIQSGLATLEKGIERTRQNYNLWFYLGFLYFDRLGNGKMEDCTRVRDKELPNIDELTDAQIESVFSKPRTWTPGHARPDENFRFAAYYLWKSVATNTEINPLRTERLYGECLQHLGLWRANKPVSEWTKWSDGGSEPWYAELRRRNHERGMDYDQTVPQLLRWCMYEQIHFFGEKTRTALASGNMNAAAVNKKDTEDAYQRFLTYFPGEKITIAGIIKDWNDTMQRQKRFGGKS